MYGKIFDSIYDGTLRAHWQGLITFQQLIILADKDGIIDMTPHAIHGRTGIPLEIIESGLDHLSKPDPYSRSNTEEGRRIVLIDDHRPWGWRLVNHAYYNKLRSAEEKRIADRERMSEKRIKSKTSQIVAESRGESPGIAKVAPVAVAVTVTTDVKDDVSAARPPRPKFIKPTIEEITAYCQSRQNSVDPHKFFNHYESNGWKVGRNPMKNWHACVHTWEASSKPGGNHGTHQQDTRSRAKRVSDTLDDIAREDAALRGVPADVG